MLLENQIELLEREEAEVELLTDRLGHTFDKVDTFVQVKEVEKQKQMLVKEASER